MYGIKETGVQEVTPVIHERYLAGRKYQYSGRGWVNSGTEVSALACLPPAACHLFLDGVEFRQVVEVLGAEGIAGAELALLLR
jgi:hypothetical protein